MTTVIHEHAAPGGGIDATTSTTAFVDWFVLGLIDVPVGTAKIVVQINLSGAYAPNECHYLLRGAIGSTAGAGEVRFDLYGVNERAAISGSFEIINPPTGSQTIALQAKRAAGAGPLRVDTASRIDCVAFID